MSDLHLYDTGRRRTVPFTTLEEGRARLYTCGPTVYNHAHIGNLRTFVASDLLRRTLQYLGYEVTQVMNLTDVDDKIIAGAAAAGQDLATFTEPYIESFFAALDGLGLERAERYPKATEHIDDMLALIGRLVDNGHAYQADGSVFFRIAADDDYGRLSGKDLDQTRRGERVMADEYDKEDARDFVLWKGAKEGEPSWESPWGPGRPGWHIECSAMSMRYLGETFDLHSGGVDLVFPHHENEIAQSESATGEEFVRHWFHSEHLIVDGAKMSKSLGNQYTLDDLLEQGASARSLRYLFLSVHYRQKLNFTFDSLAAADKALGRVDEMRFRVEHVAEADGAESLEAASTVARDAFRKALADDLNISEALAALFVYVREVNRRIEQGPLAPGDRDRVASTLTDLDRVLGVLDPTVWDQGTAGGAQDANDEAAEIDRLVAERQAAREARDFATSDRIRDELTARGIVLEDTPHGPRWKKA